MKTGGSSPSSGPVKVGSGECRDAVSPRLDLCENRVVRVGRDIDVVAGNGHRVDLAVRVMAPDSCRIRIQVRVVDARAAMLGCKRGACHDDGDTGVKTGFRAVLLGRVPDVLRIGIFPHQAGPVGALGDRDRVHRHAAHRVCRAGERVARNDCVNERLERVRIRDRVCESPGCGLGY